MKRKQISLFLVVLLAVILGIEIKLGLFIDNNPRTLWTSYIQRRNVLSYPRTREMVFRLDPAQLGIKQAELESDIWGLLLETGGDTTESLLILKDGTIKYFSSDGIEISHLELVNNIKKWCFEDLFGSASYLRPYCQKAVEFPLELRDYYRLYIFTYKGILTTENCTDNSGLQISNLDYSPGRYMHNLISCRRNQLPALVKSLKAGHNKE